MDGKPDGESGRDTLQEKKKLRSQIKELLRQNPGTEQDNRSLISHLLTSSYWGKAEQVFLFLPHIGEPDISGLIAIAMAEGKTVAAPHCHEETMFFHEVFSDWIDTTIPSSFGIQEPDTASAPLVTISPTTLLLVPGRAFSWDGKRLGRGKSYYDTFIASIPDGQKPMVMGVCWSWQVFEDIPTWELDQPMQALLTEKGIHKVNQTPPA
ncbi:5-formyltetrahydrofolate cyclo-ligase [Parasphaerochaeta coccoides]|uniref:5-formyltetrahydrofolate cyclo-ligase n=1 Tax=Parasphaerochaeta coccoides (strain ATCC BAA-1237 / DSM 17374 / SPN1) TaxID=760011 RepID=F4GKE0_PARC1|nr:5-formyltetrahydrofolate cyclo-ligase [Parasphaerochaeta coccoides]AEC02336.1 5-formyltetrahydrofolate cyclo-ligase [Parasphaerochaeta coccoides DSM 17374]